MISANTRFHSNPTSGGCHNVYEREFSANGRRTTPNVTNALNCNGLLVRKAVGETLAHLVLLESSGRARRDQERPVHWYPVGDSSGG